MSVLHHDGLQGGSSRHADQSDGSRKECTETHCWLSWKVLLKYGYSTGFVEYRPVSKDRDSESGIWMCRGADESIDSK